MKWFFCPWVGLTGSNTDWAMVSVRCISYGNREFGVSIPSLSSDRLHISISPWPEKIRGEAITSLSCRSWRSTSPCRSWERHIGYWSEVRMAEAICRGASWWDVRWADAFSWVGSHAHLTHAPTTIITDQRTERRREQISRLGVENGCPARIWSWQCKCRWQSWTGSAPDSALESASQSWRLH